MKKVLVITKESKSPGSVAEALTKEGHVVLSTELVQAQQILLTEPNIDSIALELTIPSGVEIRNEFFKRLETILEIKTPESVSYGPLTLSRSRQSAKCGAAEIRLSRREFEILQYLLNHREKLISREEILSHITSEGEIFDRTIDSHISHVRSKIKKICPEQIQIRTVYGTGYILEKKPVTV